MSNCSVNDDEPCNSTTTNVMPKSQVANVEDTAIVSDNFSLFDILEIFKDQVKVMVTELNLLSQHFNLIKDPTNPSTHQEVLKVKQSIINDITHLLKETKPLNYPSLQSLSSVNLLKTYDKISSQCKMLVYNIQQNNENMIEHTDWLKCTSIFIKDFQKELNNILAQNSISSEIEQKVSQDFNECKSDLYNILLPLDPLAKEALSLLVEYADNEEDEDKWVDIEDKPNLIMEFHKLKRDGFVLQNKKNKYLFKLNV